jgi:hypothetical protein
MDKSCNNKKLFSSFRDTLEFKKHEKHVQISRKICFLTFSQTAWKLRSNHLLLLLNLTKGTKFKWSSKIFQHYVQHQIQLEINAPIVYLRFFRRKTHILCTMGAGVSDWKKMSWEAEMELVLQRDISLKCVCAAACTYQNEHHVQIINLTSPSAYERLAHTPRALEESQTRADDHLRSNTPITVIIPWHIASAAPFNCVASGATSCLATRKRRTREQIYGHNKQTSWQLGREKREKCSNAAARGYRTRTR